MNNEELKQMSGDELIGIIKAQKFEIKEKNLLIQELRDTIDNQREEIEKLNNLNKQLVEECQRLDDEETRLNNIINEFEEYIKSEIPEEEFVNSEWYVNILDKIKELKENK